jgi:hypothetical protein
MARPWLKSLSLFIFILCGYLVGFDVQFTGDVVPNQLLPISLLREGNFDFNEFVGPQRRAHLPYYFQIVNGRIISTYPILPGVLNLPIYALATTMGVDIGQLRRQLSFLSACWITALSAVFVFLSLLRAGRRECTALIFSLVYAFGTCVWSVASRSIWQHGPSLLFISISLWLLLSPTGRQVPWAGFFLGLAVFNRPINLLIALPLALFVLIHRRRRALAFTLLALIPASLMAWYSLSYFGRLESLGQGQSFVSGNIFEGLAGILVSPARGLLIFSPIFVFAFAGMARTLRDRQAEPIYKYLAAAVAFFLMAMAAWKMWWGGWSFGYRLLIEIVPLLILILALYWEAVIVSSPWRRRAFTTALLFSVYANFLGANYFPSSFNGIPDNIDVHTERLWSPMRTELTLCTIKFLRDWRVLPRPDHARGRTNKPLRERSVRSKKKQARWRRHRA